MVSCSGVGLSNQTFHQVRLFVGSGCGGDRAAMMYTLLATARLNEVDPLAWLSDVLARIADLPQGQLHELLPWNWKALQQADTMEMAA